MEAQIRCLPPSLQAYLCMPELHTPLFSPPLYEQLLWIWCHLWYLLRPCECCLCFLLHPLGCQCPRHWLPVFKMRSRSQAARVPQNHISRNSTLRFGILYTPRCCYCCWDCSSGQSSCWQPGSMCNTHYCRSHVEQRWCDIFDSRLRLPGQAMSFLGSSTPHYPPDHVHP